MSQQNCTRLVQTSGAILYGKPPSYGRINVNIYIFSIFTEKPYGKSLEHNAVYIPITTSSKNKHGSLQSDWTSALFCS